MYFLIAFEMLTLQFILDAFIEVLHSFSLLRNVNLVMKTEVGNRDLTYLHGIRVLSLFWIILLHVNLFVSTDLPSGKFTPLIASKLLMAEIAIFYLQSLRKVIVQNLKSLKSTFTLNNRNFLVF